VRDAVAAIGDPAVPVLERLLAEGSADDRGFAGRTLAEIGSARAVRALTRLIRAADVDRRNLGLQNLRRVRVQIGRPILPRATVHRLFRAELAEYRDRIEPGRRYETHPEPEIRLLSESFLEAADMALERAMAALACWYE